MLEYFQTEVDDPENMLDNRQTEIDPADPVEDILNNNSQNDISVTESLLDHAEMKTKSFTQLSLFEKKQQRVWNSKQKIC